MDEDLLKRQTVASTLRSADRGKWRRGDEAELAAEVRTYQKHLQDQVRDAVEGRKRELNQRHKTAWDTLAEGLARAVETDNPDIANAVIAVSGSWHQSPLTKGARWQEISRNAGAAVAFLQDVGRNALNVYTGLASVNKGKSSGFDPHWLNDLLGMQKVHDSAEGSMTPFSAAVMNVPSSGLFSGATPLSKGHIRGLLEGSVEHYKRLQALSEGSEADKAYYGEKIKRLMGTGWAMSALG